MLAQNLVHLRNGVRRPLDRQNQFDLLVARMLSCSQIENVLGSIPLVGGQIELSLFSTVFIQPFRSKSVSVSTLMLRPAAATETS